MGFLLRIFNILFSRKPYRARSQDPGQRRAQLWFLMVAMPQMLIEYNKICKSGNNHGLSISNSKFKSRSKSKVRSANNISFSPGKLIGITMKNGLRKRKQHSR